MNSKKRGLFIVFEGLDRTGKSTQANMLHEYFQAQNVNSKKISFPNRETPIGKIISSYLTKETHHSDQAIHLLFSANRWEEKHGILEETRQGITLVSDRYAYSGVAYSSAKGLDLNWCMYPDRGLPKPDLVFFLDATVPSIMGREGFGHERYEDVKFLETVYTRFRELYDPTNWVFLEATSSSAEDIHERVVQEINKVMEEKQAQEIKEDLFNNLIA